MNGASVRRRWLVGALVVSLAVNAFIIGAAATNLVHIRWPFQEQAHKPKFRFELGWLKGRLPPDGMARVEAAVAAAGPEAGVHLERLRALRRELATLIAEPQPDRTAIDAKLAEIRAELTEMQAGIQRVSTEALLALPLETRSGLTQEPRTQK